nr:MAG TPA: hypothetical protein [Caudoviricetes sp.]
MQIFKISPIFAKPRKQSSFLLYSYVLRPFS